MARSRPSGIASGIPPVYRPPSSSSDDEDDDDSASAIESRRQHILDSIAKLEGKPNRSTANLASPQQSSDLRHPLFPPQLPFFHHQPGSFAQATQQHHQFSLPMSNSSHSFYPHHPMASHQMGYSTQPAFHSHPASHLPMSNSQPQHFQHHQIDHFPMAHYHPQPGAFNPYLMQKSNTNKLPMANAHYMLPSAWNPTSTVQDQYARGRIMSQRSIERNEKFNPNRQAQTKAGLSQVDPNQIKTMNYSIQSKLESFQNHNQSLKSKRLSKVNFKSSIEILQQTSLKSNNNTINNFKSNQSLPNFQNLQQKSIIKNKKKTDKFSWFDY